MLHRLRALASRLASKLRKNDEISVPLATSYVLVLAIGDDWTEEAGRECAEAVGEQGCLWHEQDPDVETRLAYVLAPSLPAIAQAAWALASLQTGTHDVEPADA